MSDQAEQDPRQTQIPETGGTAAQQAMRAIHVHAERRTQEIFGKCPPAISPQWYESLRASCKEELISTFKLAMRAIAGDS